MITADSLSFDAVWEHRIGTDRVIVDITLSDGRRIRSEALRGVINRLQQVPTDAMVLMHSSEYDYVYHEMNTFFMSWLSALPQPVLNRPKPGGLSGGSPHISEWIWLASRAGLPTPEYVYTDQDYLRVNSGYASAIQTVFVVDHSLIGQTASSDMNRSCIRLAELSGIELLGIDFTIGPNETWSFAGATSYPDLRIGGADLLDALADILKNGWRFGK
jgi:hypothetical protein